MGRLVRLELPADDPDRAIAFYRGAFGWTVKKGNGASQDYWLVAAGDSSPGIGAIMRRSQPGQTTVNTITVEDVDAAVDRVIAAGGSLILPRTTIPGVGYFVYCQDTEGTTFGLMQPDARAGTSTSPRRAQAVTLAPSQPGSRPNGHSGRLRRSGSELRPARPPIRRGAPQAPA